MSKATENELSLLHSLVARKLMEKIEAGEASASDYGNALKMLKDNNITCDPGGDNALSGLAAALAGAGGVKKVDSVDLSAALDKIDFDTSRSN